MPTEVTKTALTMQKDDWIWDMPGPHHGEEGVARLSKATENKKISGFNLYFLTVLGQWLASFCVCRTGICMTVWLWGKRTNTFFKYQRALRHFEYCSAWLAPVCGTYSLGVHSVSLAQLCFCLMSCQIQHTWSMGLLWNLLSECFIDKSYYTGVLDSRWLETCSSRRQFKLMSPRSGENDLTT